MFIFSAALLVSTSALAAVTSITPSTWNVIGLDSNTPAFGPNRFPVGAQVCSNSAGPVTAQLHWDTGGTTSDDSVIKLRGGTSDTITLDFATAGCLDAFFEVEVTKADTSFDQTRRYHITASGVSTPTPREIKVERLVSQSRNYISDMAFGPSVDSLTSVPNGGSFALIVGNTYFIRMSGATATQGYEQLESFVNFPNTIFQVLSVESTYSADTSPIVNSPNDKLYSDACGWDNDPTSPSYLSCSVDGKAGGAVAVTYQVKILNVSSSRETLNSLIHDFSGSSFHYNADFSTSARFANIVNPNDLQITKRFAPTPIASGEISSLTISITNPTYGSIGGLTFTDTFPTLPGNMVVAPTPNESTSTCGTPIFTPTAGAGSITFSNGTVPALSTCLIKVDVTAPTQGTYNNTTGALSAEGNSTGKTASASLVIDDNAFPPPYPPQTCATPTTLATWNFDTLSTGTNFSPAASTTYADVSNVAANCVGCTASDIVNTPSDTPSNSWMAQGWLASGTVGPTTQPYYQFSLDASKFGNVRISWRGRRDTGWSGTGNTIQTFTYIDGILNRTDSSTTITTNSWTNYANYDTATGVGGASASNTAGGTTEFRLNAYHRLLNRDNADLYVDTVVIDGCAIVPTDPPEIAKVFSPATVAQGDTSTLTFTITNPNTTTPGPALSLSGVTVTDTFPAGLTVANLTTSNTCGGSLVDDTGGVLAVGATGIRLTDGSIAAPVDATPTTCTFTVEVKTPAPDPDPTKNVTLTFENTSRSVAASESGANTDSTTGVAKATLKALAPPVIRKLFGIDPIFTSVFGGYSPITFTILNPNTADEMTNVAFSDTFPTAPGNMVVASPTGAVTSDCGTPTFAPVAGAGSITFSDGTIAAGDTCTVTVNVAAAAAGLYTNTTGNVSHVLNGYTANGNIDSDTLIVETATPAIALLKQVGPSSTGPWSSYLAVAPNGDVYYKFTVENTGDVNLDSVYVSDQAGLPAPLNMDSCIWRDGNNNILPLSPPSPSTFSLPIADADNGHIATCILGPAIADSALSPHDNTAQAHGTFGATTVDSLEDSATYATTALTLDKTADKAYYLAAGEDITYSYAINNAGADLIGPLTIVVTDNKITSVSCPDLTTIGNLDSDFNTGETLTCTAIYTVTPSDLIAEQITNIARANIRDGIALNINTPQDTLTVLAGPDLVVTKTNNVGGTAATNVPFIWTLTATNTTSLGLTSTFTNGQRLLVDKLPGGPTYSAPAVAINTGATTGTISCSIASDTLTCTATDNVAIPPDGGFIIAVTTTSPDAVPLVNPTGGDCRIDPDDLIVEINDSNNDCSDTVDVVTPALTLVKTADVPYFVKAGDPIGYTYKVSNTGAASLAGPVTITDDKTTVVCLPVTSAINPATGLPVINDNNLDPLEEVTCTAASYTVLGTDVTAGQVTNIATATIDNSGVPVHSPQFSLTVPIGPDLEVVKTHPSTTPVPGSPFDWTLTVTNAPTAGYAAIFDGTVTTQAMLIDDLPAGLVYSVPATATNTGGTTGTIDCALASDTLTCSTSGIVSIPPGGGFSIAVATTSALGGTLTNPRSSGICRVDPDSLVLEIDETPASNDCSDSVLVGKPLLTVLKSADTATASPGGLINYSLIISNSGPAMAKNVKIEDFLGRYTALAIDPYSNGTAFNFNSGTSGLSVQTIEYSNDTDDSDGISYGYTPADPSGFDGNVTHWRIIMGGDMNASPSQFTLQYQVKVK